MSEVIPSITSQSLPRNRTFILYDQWQPKGHAFVANTYTLYMDTDDKPIAPKRRNRKKLSYSSNYDAQLEKKEGDILTDNKTDDQNEVHLDTINVESKTDIGQDESAHINTTDEKKDQGDTDFRSYLNHQVQYISDGEEQSNGSPFKSMDNKEVIKRHENVIKTSQSSSEIQKQKGGDTMYAKEVSLQTECTGGLDSNESSGSQSEYGTQDSDAKRKPKDDYPDDLNPFRDSDSDSDGSQKSRDNSSDNSNLETGPLRLTTKSRPSLYPWMPFSEQRNEYKSHMIPVRKAVKKRASLYPWRPFGEEDYPEELNPFSDPTPKKNGSQEKRNFWVDLNNSSENNSQQRNGKPCDTEPAGDKEADLNCQASRDSGAVEIKKLGRSKKFCKIAKRKLRKFWNRVLRR